VWTTMKGTYTKGANKMGGAANSLTQEGRAERL